MPMNFDEEPPASPYRVGPWTVRRLKDELRSKQLPVTGNKDELIKRLELADSGNVSSPRATKRAVSPVKRDVSPVKPEVESEEQKSAEHFSQFTITLLQKELRNRNLATSGRKDALIQRLVQFEEEKKKSSPRKSTSPAKLSSPKRESPRKSPSKRSLDDKIIDSLIENPKVGRVLETLEESPLLMSKAGVSGVVIHRREKELSFLRAPHKVLWYSFMFFLTRSGRLIKYFASHKLLSSLLVALVSGIYALNCMEGPHQATLRHVEELILWYGRWFILGVLSSIGLGTGAHTFLLFLGPFIAEVTTAAYTCKSLDFAVDGVNAFLCPDTVSNVIVNIWHIANKVKFEAFFWGAGTAFGELPPYFIARATAIAGKSSGEISELKELQSKPKNQLKLSEKAHLWMFYLVQYMGFIGILLCASIPNPLFDLAGITCGYFHVPFLTFWSATFIGKAFFKAGIQALFVIMLFSKENIEFLIGTLSRMSPEWGSYVTNWLNHQKNAFGNQQIDDGGNVLSVVWNVILFSMLGYFALSILQSVAVIYQKEQQMKGKKKSKNSSK